MTRKRWVLLGPLVAVAALGAAAFALRDRLHFRHRPEREPTGAQEPVGSLDPSAPAPRGFIPGPHKQLVDPDDLRPVRKKTEPFPIDRALLSDFPALLQRILSLQTKGGGPEREAYIREFCGKVEKDPAEIERFIAYAASLQSWAESRLALILLGRMEAEAATSYLLRVIEADSERSLIAISSFRQSKDHEFNLENLDHVQYAMSVYLSEPKARSLLALLDRPFRPETRKAIIQAVGASQKSEALPAELRRSIADMLLKSAADPVEDPEIRSASLIEFASVEPDRKREVHDLCLRILQTEKDDGIRFSAVSHVLVDAPADVEVVLEIVGKEKNNQIRSKLVWELPMNDQTAEVLERLAFSDPYDSTRAGCARKLVEWGERGRGIVERMAQTDTSPSVRDSARKFLERFKKN